MRGPDGRQPLTMAVIVLSLVSGCTMLPMPATPVQTDPPFLPGSPAPSELVEPLGSIILLRAYSGTFARHDQRIEVAFPDVVVFVDGTVVANIALVSDPPDFRAVRLTAGELEEVTELVAEAELAPLAGAEGPLGCFDCGATIIRTQQDGATIEIAAKGLMTTGMRPEWVEQLPYDPGVIAVDRLLDALVKRVQDGPAEPYSEALPQIPVAPFSGG